MSPCIMSCMRILVTLHVSVWVEIMGGYTHANYMYVTLHVSVWVEIMKSIMEKKRLIVTLHVSVWVEIELWWLGINMITSRSTWACELKYIYDKSTTSCSASRSTWACELKFSMSLPQRPRACHAPRERVSWNQYLDKSILRPSVTLHVSVWVEISKGWAVLQWLSSRSTWACELK